MTLTLDVKTGDVHGVDDYVAWVRDHVDLGDEDSILDSAPHLLALSNDRSFLAETLNRQLEDWPRFQMGNGYISQTFLLGRGPGFFVRANVWLPEPESPEPIESLSFYRVVHNHNFSFLTVGYWGSGYETEIYETDPRRLAPVLGHEVELEFRERTRLPVGKVMYYRAERDVHLQLPSETFSVSLNLMIVPPEMGLLNQYYFDLETRRVVTLTGSRNESRMLLCDLAAAVGDDRTLGLLDRLAERHPNDRVRDTARAGRDALAQRSR